jgi:hypothetical protein
MRANGFSVDLLVDLVRGGLGERGVRAHGHGPAHH